MNFNLLYKLICIVFTLQILTFSSAFALSKDNYTDLICAEKSIQNGILIKGTIVTMDDYMNVIENGTVAIKGEKIVAVLEEGEQIPTGFENALEITTDSYIFPGLINAHDHMSYNSIPVWDVPKRFTNRYEWQSYSAYKKDISNPHQMLTDPNLLGLKIEVNKWAEMKAIASGTTSVQGGYYHEAIYKILARNIDFTNFGQDKVYTRVSSISTMTDTEAQALLDKIDQGQVDAWIVHLAEGVDASSRYEFTELKQLNLLTNVTRIVHGTALTYDDFKEMASAGAELFWSPLSNLLLYGTTTNITAALNANVTITLTTDWSPSGGKNLLVELKYAYEYSNEYLNGILSPQYLAKMVTRNPAKAIGWDNFVGHIAPNMYADLVVYSKLDPDPYLSLIKTTEREVELVFVSGDPLYGDVHYMSVLKPDDYEVLQFTDFSKAIDITKSGVEFGYQNYTYVYNKLAPAMPMNNAYLKAHIKDPSVANMTDYEFELWLSDKFPEGLTGYELDNLITWFDNHFFDTIRNSTNAPLPFDIERIYYSKDTVPPTVIQVEMMHSVSTPPVVSIGKLTINITFSEKLNTVIYPTITFGKHPPYDEHVITEKIWLTSKSIQAYYNITASMGDGMYFLNITGAEDMARNVLKPCTNYSFTVDTKSPSIIDFDVNPSGGTPPMVTKGTITFKFVFSELMHTSLPTLTFGREHPYIKYTFLDTDINWLNNTVLTAKYRISDEIGDGRYKICISDAMDIARNRIQRLMFDFIVDTTSPTVVSCYPQNNTKNVTVSNIIAIITFSEPMDTKSVENAITVYGIDDFTFEWSSDCKTVKIIAPMSLKKGTTYVIVIKATAKDIAGNEIMPFILTFTTEEGVQVVEEDFSAILFITIVLACICISVILLSFLFKKRFFKKRR